MRRFYLREGDKTAAGGTVLEGLRNCKIYGIPQTFVGAKVYCPACKTEGEIVANGPRLKDFIFGKEAALSDDLCACKCARWPVLLASQDTDYQSISGQQNGSTTRPDAKLTSKHEVFDQCFVLRDELSKNPLHGEPYRILDVSGAIIAEGMTDASGRTTRYQSSASSGIYLQILEA